jgi:MFS transporter, Spinster family, sphingosine-1-phosphate transporter
MQNKKNNPRYRWFVVTVFFGFMLLHQSDRLLIAPLTTSIMDTFHINEAQMGAVSTGALLVAVVFYPLWGYLYDRYARSKLLSLAALIWGSTTWLNALAPTFPLFMATRATTGIDDSSYPGLYSLISDYFGPQVRGKVYGLLQLTQPLGYLTGMILALTLRDVIGWRKIFFITGSLGIVVSVVIYFAVREPKRGKSEPELENLEEIGIYRFDKKIAMGLFRKPTLLLLYVQGFFGVFPWNVITFWFFAYLEKERHYAESTILFTMAPAVLILASGYFVGGALGDFMFKRTVRGRLIVSAVGILLGAIGLYLTMRVPLGSPVLFMILLCLTAIFIPFGSPNVLSTVYDITLPEIRSTAIAVESFIEESGAALAPLIAGVIATASSLQNAILVICLSTWLMCAFFISIAAYLVPRDIKVLRDQLKERAENEQRLQTERAAG